MGIVMLGAATLTPVGWNGAVFQMFAHGVMTALLFALVGLVYERAHTRAIALMGGLAASMPAIAGFFTLACLSSLGLPGTAGFAAELMVFLGAWQGAHPWWAVPAIAGAFVTAVYVLRASRTIFWGPRDAAPNPDLHDPRGAEWAAPIMLGGAIVLLGLWPRLLLDVIDGASTVYLQPIAELFGRLP
jgi:NADH-quinone oxidoreductase subunit M